MELFNLILKIIAAFGATIAISITMQVPKKEIFFSGLTGAISYATYGFLLYFDFSTTAAVIIAAIVLTTVSRILAYNRKNPVTLFLVPGFIPLSPGSLIYYTMSYAINGDTQMAFINFSEAMMRAGCIALGMSFVFIIEHRFYKIKIPFIYKKR
ncbi:MAG: threonine/serine exporter family protein [Lachnospirales bacterium]